MNPAADGSARSAATAIVLPVAVLGLVVVVPLTALVVACWLGGWRLQPVDSASMAPTYPSGALLVVQPVDPNDVEPGTAIVFDDPAQPGRLVAHRVTDRLPGDRPTFRTQGDANADADPFPVPAAAVRGRVRWGIPGLGAAARMFRWPVNAAVFMGVPALLLVLTEVSTRTAAARAPADAGVVASPVVSTATVERSHTGPAPRRARAAPLVASTRRAPPYGATS